MELLIPNYKNVKVMVVGDIMLDRYWHGSTNRISPEAPVPILKINNTEDRPGGAANVAMNIASLQARSILIGLTGIDDEAQILANILSNYNIKYNFFSIPSYQTITKLRVLSQNQQLIRIDFEKDLEFINKEKIYKYINKFLKNIDILVLSDYAKGTLTNAKKIIQRAKILDIPVIVDPKGVDFEKYRGATLITPNIYEFESVVGKCKNEDELIKLGDNLIKNFEFLAILITRDKNGMTLLQLNKSPIHIPTQAKEVYDVTGAGDTVVGVLAATLAAGSTLEEACYFANIAAGIVINKLGNSTVSLTELENVVYNRSRSKEMHFGIITESDLKIAILSARKRKEKIVMTNGVFDIIHAGHISYLKNARKLGDRLIVAVNSDSSARRLKGKNRPINSLKQRMIVLEALESVDWVVAFEEDTPQRLIESISPDLLVKGGDYKYEYIVGSKEVLSNGGKVTALNFIEGQSTTNIISQIINNF